MAGSWELDPRSVLVCSLHVDNTTVYWAMGLRRLRWPGPYQDLVPVTGMPFDHARNKCVEYLLGSSAQYLFFLDSDVIPPPDTIYRLLAHGQPIMSGMYCRRSPPAAVPVMMKNGTWITNFKPGSIVEADVVGAGCLLVHRSVFEKVPHQRQGHQWFDWRVNMQGHLPPQECMSEDFTWCNHVRKFGYKILVDTSVKCKHVGFAESDLGVFGPVGSTGA